MQLPTVFIVAALADMSFLALLPSYIAQFPDILHR